MWCRRCYPRHSAASRPPASFFDKPVLIQQHQKRKLERLDTLSTFSRSEALVLLCCLVFSEPCPSCFGVFFLWQGRRGGGGGQGGVLGAAGSGFGCSVQECVMRAKSIGERAQPICEDMVTSGQRNPALVCHYEQLAVKWCNSYYS